MLKKASVLLCFLKSELRKQLQRKKQYLTELSEYLQAFPTVVLSKFDWIKVVTCISVYEFFADLILLIIIFNSRYC